MEIKWYLKILLFLTLSVLFIGCDSAYIYEKNSNLKGNWNRYDTASFRIEIDDTISYYNLYVDIRNNNNYRYSNLYIFFHTGFPNGISTHDTIEFIIAGRDGKWLGKGLGDIKESNIPIKMNFLFPLSGEYIFRLEQAMRVEDLTGIEDIGIRIEKVIQE